MINNILVKRETKREKSDINEHNDSWAVAHCDRFSGKSEPVRVINDPYQWVAFTVGQAWDGLQSCPGWFLDEDNVKVEMGFKDYVDNEVVFSDIL